MAPRSYNPYRKCDFCGANNYPNWYTRFERRAWTLHTHSNKMTCPNCRKKGEEVERLSIAEMIRHRRAMEGIVAEPSPDVIASGLSDTSGQGAAWRSVIQSRNGESELDYRLLQPEDGLRSDVNEPPAAYGFGVPGQYRRIKAQYPDAVLLFRIGDWYVAMNEDADTVSRELGTAVHRFPPLSTRSTEFAATALEQYLPKLVKAGYRVAICDRIEEPNGRKHLQVDECGGPETDDRLPRPADGPRSDVGGVCEPQALYGQAAKDKRYQDNEKRKVIARLEDIAGVLRRHDALPDAKRWANLMPVIAENAAIEQVMLRIDAIRAELALRSVWIDHHGRIICRVDECWWKFRAENVLDLLAEARKLYSGKQLSEGLPKMGAARMRFTDEDLLELAEHNAAVAAKSNSPALRTYFGELLLKARQACGVDSQAA